MHGNDGLLPVNHLRLKHSSTLVCLIALAFFLSVPKPGVADGDVLLDLIADSGTGSVHLQLDSLPAELLYVPILESGVGSNDLSLDRGQFDRNKAIRNFRGNTQAEAAAHEIRSFLDRQPGEATKAPETVPPGSPIG